MKETKHTSGPWTIGEMDRDEGIFPIYFCDCNDGIPDAEVYISDAPDDNAAQNARLIAAAPDLLAILEEVFDRMCKHGSGDVLFRSKVEAAIAKATGKKC